MHTTVLPWKEKKKRKKFPARFPLVTKSKQHLNVPSKCLPQHGAVRARLKCSSPLFLLLLLLLSARIRVELGAAEVVEGVRRGGVYACGLKYLSWSVQS